MPQLERLGHVGLHVNDLDKMKDFYSRVVGLHISEDQSAERGNVFFTSNPEWEHHELFMTTGRDAPVGSMILQQISFHAPTLEDVQAYVERFRKEGVRIEHTVTHGFAISVYFFDPEGNRLEIYWGTKVRGHKAFLRPLDTQRPVEEVLADAKRILEEIPVLAG
jgi:catechol-2,3-dioxygenase